MQSMTLGADLRELANGASEGFKRQHPLCLGSQSIGRVSATEVTDHVEPQKADPAKFGNADMWQPSCKWHHDLAKQLLERAFAKANSRLLISGSTARE